MKFQVVHDPVEEENWEDWQNKYPKESRALARNMWNFVRREFKVDPRKLGKKKMEKLFMDMAQSKTVRYQRKISLPAYREGRTMGRRLVGSREGKVHKKGAWSKGLYSEVVTYHESHTREGVAYTRSYNRWSPNELAIIKSEKLSLEHKIELTGRSESSVVTRMRRL